MLVVIIKVERQKFVKISISLVIFNKLSSNLESELITLFFFFLPNLLTRIPKVFVNLQNYLVKSLIFRFDTGLLDDLAIFTNFLLSV